MAQKRGVHNTLASMILGEIPAFPLPPLPPITDPVLSRTALTHPSLHQNHRRPFDLEGADRPEDYEKLEHVGDALLGSVVTLLLHDLHPDLDPGAATSLLVSNETLAELCQRYHLHDNFIGAPAALPTIRAAVGTRACLFEAYIAAVYYDFLTSERPGLYPSGSQSTAPSITGATIGSDVGDDGDAAFGDDGAEERSQTPTPTEPPETPTGLEDLSISGNKTPPARPGSAAPSATSSAAVPSAYVHVASDAELPPLVPRYKRTRGMAVDYLESWLRPLFTPVAEVGLQSMRAKWREYQASGAAEDGDLDARAIGALSALNQFTNAKWACMPRYKDAGATESGGWKFEGEVTSPEGKTYAATAVRPNKKSAQTVLAYKIGKAMQADGHNVGLA
ncbi:hypothetical protein A1Q1_01922 [Trichosporon asahii var. asahii CBS 2479]|uniref:RNase III domain-containing protein n=1 Tax=Trichosporon asahii var. asahii (strain ATCC 90039 / CBS 2479 / JCM 2466 / KCTC 7840 / NBRC 103889/ NCYC 2677 / UAMH 7654) TaxID=1186058 RepID=J5T3W5_TRIAS|nr:hypothetical protein A1Q1_01922 [Trichosporon asahii var. asahii CBS 2479]EJT49011.1 hypothetical protein A1Q1_01922 [Trichosporon asahii var. asahii CBS 2479]